MNTIHQIIQAVMPAERYENFRRIRLLLGYWLMVLSIQICMLAYGQMWDTPLWFFALNLPLGVTGVSTFLVWWRFRQLFSPLICKVLMAVPTITLITPCIIVFITRLIQPD